MLRPAIYLGKRLFMLICQVFQSREVKIIQTLKICQQVEIGILLKRPINQQIKKIIKPKPNKYMFKILDSLKK